jgi:hypothetical protein
MNANHRDILAAWHGAPARAAPAVPTCLQRIVEALVACCDPDEILLFGSYAKGMGRLDSDVDLLVIGKNFDRSRRDLTCELGGFLRQFALPIEPILVTPAELAERITDPYSFLSSALMHAVLLYRHKEFPCVFSGSG